MLEEQDNSTGDAVEEDLLLRPRHRTAEQGDLDITPMIDITFLLLIFFLVASRVEPDVAQLPKAEYGEGVSAKTAVILTVVRGPGENDLIYRGDNLADDNLVDSSDLAQQEAIITDYVERQFQGRVPGEAAKERVIIKGALDVRSREISRVAKAVAQADTSPRELKLYVAVREAGK